MAQTQTASASVALGLSPGLALVTCLTIILSLHLPVASGYTGSKVSKILPHANQSLVSTYRKRKCSLVLYQFSRHLTSIGQRANLF